MEKSFCLPAKSYFAFYTLWESMFVVCNNRFNLRWSAFIQIVVKFECDICEENAHFTEGVRCHNF